jgi:hypothetical protein
MNKIITSSALCFVFATTAFAEQAPDALVVTGPNMQQLSLNNLLVTPAGGAQMSLKNALAFGGTYRRLRLSD